MNYNKMIYLMLIIQIIILSFSNVISGSSSVPKDSFHYDFQIYSIPGNPELNEWNFVLTTF